MSLDSGVTRHGYTGHEQVDEAGLIHMNGRIYDPKLMRFVQADPIIQSPFRKWGQVDFAASHATDLGCRNSSPNSANPRPHGPAGTARGQCGTSE